MRELKKNDYCKVSIPKAITNTNFDAEFVRSPSRGKQIQGHLYSIETEADWLALAPGRAKKHMKLSTNTHDFYSKRLKTPAHCIITKF